LIAAAPRHEWARIGWRGRCPALDRRWKYLTLVAYAETTIGVRVPPLDVLHLLDHMPPPRGLDAASVVTLHEFYDKVREGWPVYRALCARMDRADRIVAVSRAVGEDYRHRVARRADAVDVVPNGIDLDVFKPAAGDGAAVRARHGIPGPYVMHAGVMTERKNPVGLIRALANLRDRGRVPPFFVSVGAYHAGPGRETRLRALAAEAGVADRLIVLARGVSGLEMAALYGASLGLVFPSLHEGFGLPAVEALACGTPCVVADTGGLPEVTGRLGILCDPRDPVSIARGIERLMDDTAHRAHIAAEGPRHAQAFSLDAMARGYLEVYRRAARDREARP
jgi:D-inositol-3-phosphate glycosyltransferase